MKPRIVSPRRPRSVHEGHESLMLYQVWISDFARRLNLPFMGACLDVGEHEFPCPTHAVPDVSRKTLSGGMQLSTQKSAEKNRFSEIFLLNSTTILPYKYKFSRPKTT